MELPEDAILPLPPPFMFACGECAALLASLAEAIRRDEGCFYEQLAVARHIAAAHPGDVPPPHTSGCTQCPQYAGRPDIENVWAEHRARDLFLHESVARLL
ncbi:hypothetical protein AB0P05_33300 [Streptomyces flaveolus]|uniref:hypothetical protein n=1 Tax=Streptomyces flaveolus TaxID=67297 RepID=UPI00343A113E